MSAFRIINSNKYLILYGCVVPTCFYMTLLTFLFEILMYIVDLGYLFRFSGLIYLNYFKIYDRIDQILGTTYNTIIKARVLKYTICLASSSCMFLIPATLFWFSLIEAGSMLFVILWSTVFIIRFKHSLTIIELCANIIQIEYRLKVIRVKLNDLYSFAINRFDRVNVGGIHWLYSSNHKENSRGMVLPSKITVTDLNKLQKCYLLLLEQNNHINQRFGVRSYSTSYLVRGISNTLNLIDMTAHVFTLVYRCEKAYEQRKDIISVLDHLIAHKTFSKYGNCKRRHKLFNFLNMFVTMFVHGRLT
ncbi:hypothetical protein ABMA28_006027 [Loxostege sticticalis]|uniref:Gustatory receptor n=1 Tax=Loxostege sticticalis TaxID=481309 RepID=A0ABD0SKF1_LOXSC